MLQGKYKPKAVKERSKKGNKTISHRRVLHNLSLPFCAKPQTIAELYAEVL
jgi:hypothetical protein